MRPKMTAWAALPPAEKVERLLWAHAALFIGYTEARSGALARLFRRYRRALAADLAKGTPEALEQHLRWGTSLDG